MHDVAQLLRGWLLSVNPEDDAPPVESVEDLESLVRHRVADAHGLADDQLLQLPSSSGAAPFCFKSATVSPRGGAVRDIGRSARTRSGEVQARS